MKSEDYHLLKPIQKTNRILTKPWYYTVKLSEQLDAELLKDLLDIIAWKAKPSTNSILDSLSREQLEEAYDMVLQLDR